MSQAIICNFYLNPTTSLSQLNLCIQHCWKISLGRWDIRINCKDVSYSMITRMMTPNLVRLLPKRSLASEFSWMRPWNSKVEFNICIQTNTPWIICKKEKNNLICFNIESPKHNLFFFFFFFFLQLSFMKIAIFFVVRTNDYFIKNKILFLLIFKWK